MRSVFLLLVLSVPAFSADIGAPVPLPRADSPTFNADVVAKLADIDARLARMETARAGATSAVSADCPCGAACPCAGVQRAATTAAPMTYTRVCDGNQCYLVPTSQATGTTPYAAPAFGGCGASATTGYRTGPVRRLFGGLFGGCQ